MTSAVENVFDVLDQISKTRIPGVNNVCGVSAPVGPKSVDTTLVVVDKDGGVQLPKDSNKVVAETPGAREAGLKSGTDAIRDQKVAVVCVPKM